MRMFVVEVRIGSVWLPATNSGPVSRNKADKIKHRYKENHPGAQVRAREVRTTDAHSG